MARLGNYPITYDEMKSFSIADLRKWGYLVLGNWKTGTITWSRNGNPIGSISITAQMEREAPYITLSYTINKEKDVKYNVSLVSVASNLGKGNVWYFRCPYTNKLCRKLYSIEGYFMHREGIKGYYEKQIQSKHYRHLEKAYGPLFQQDKLYMQLYSKYFRKYYNGKPTKRYLKIMNQLKAAEYVSETDLVNGMIKR